MQHFLKDINPNMCHFRLTCTLIMSYFWGFILDFRTTVPGLSKTSVLVLPLGLFDRSRSRTVGPLVSKASRESEAEQEGGVKLRRLLFALQTALAQRPRKCGAVWVAPLVSGRNDLKSTLAHCFILT